jgi:hypothetical protein
VKTCGGIEPAQDAVMAPGALLDSARNLDEIVRFGFDAVRAELVAERNELLVRLGRVEAERDRWRRRAERLEAQNAELKGALEEARRAAKRQAAPFARRKRKEHPKSPGRAAGNPAANRPVPEQIDEDVFVPLAACPVCRGGVTHVRDLDPQIVIDVSPPPDVRKRVRRFHNQSGYCAQCRKRVASRDADQSSNARGASGVQIGPQLISLATDLHYRIGVTFRKISGIFTLIFGLTFSPAAWARAARRVSRRLQPTYLSLVTAARKSDVSHVDETGWYITGAGTKKPWLHVFAVPALGITLFAIRLSRGRDVALEMLGQDYQGTSGIDGWAAYLQLPWRKGQCNGHFLRRCAELLEVQTRGAARFPLAVRRLLLDGIEVKGLLPALPPEDGAALADQMRGELRQVLAGQIEEPANERFANHLRRHEDEVFTYLDVPGLGATNNEAEREIRPAVVVRKISAGNRTLLGAHDHEIIASVSRTAERNHRLLPSLLPALLRDPNPDTILSVLGARPMPPPANPLPTWKEMTEDANRDANPRRVRPTSRQVARVAREEARAPPA